MRILIIASSGDISRRQGPPDGYAFRKAGVNVHVLLPKPIRGGELAAEIDGIRFHMSFVFPFPRLFLISYIFFGVLKTIKLLYTYDFDVIHGHSAIGGIIGVLSKLVTRKKIIVDFHYWEPSPGILEVYQGKWTDKDIRLKMSNMLVKFVASNSNLIVATSNELKEDLKRKGINEKKIKVLYYAVDTDNFHPRRHGTFLAETYGIYKRPLILFVGMLHKLARVDKIIHSFVKVLEKYPSAQFVVVGDGPEKNRLQGLSKELKIAENVHFIGLLPHVEIPKIIDSADICVTPIINEYYEKTGLVPTKILEYLAMGKPVITMVGGSIKEIADKKACIPLNHSKDPYAFAHKIVELLDHPELAKEISNNALNLVKERYSWKKVIHQYLFHYKEL